MSASPEAATAILRRHERMKTSRVNTVENTWRDCFDYTFPIRGNGLNGAVISINSTQAKQAELLDGTASDSSLILAANIMAGMTPANALWFGLDVGTESDEERRWLDDSAKLLWENIHMSNFDAEAFDGCLDIVCAGQFALYVDEDRERGGLVFSLWSLATVYVGSTRADGKIDIVHREYKLNAEQACKEFGENNVSEKIRKAYREGNLDEEFKFVHAIFPRTPHAVGAKLAKNLPIASMHLELDSKHLVRESGYHEMPVILPRWMRAPDSMYAVGPMYTALPDVRTLNELKALELAGADIAVSGMWLGIDDGVFNPRTVKLGPRKIILAADKDSLSALHSGANFELGEHIVSRLQAAIRKTLMADQLPPADGPMKTAYEYSVRVDLIRKLLGPIYGRLQAEYLKPLVERCFGLAYRAGIFKPAPQSLRGRAFAVKYESPIARAQKLDEVMAIESVFASAAQLEAAVPGTMDYLDVPEALKRISAGRGAPGAILRTADAVKELRAERAAQVKQQTAEAGAAQAQAVGMEESVKRAAAR